VRGELTPGFPVGWLLGEPVKTGSAARAGSVTPKYLRLALGAVLTAEPSREA
jgi:hypothetical protein